MGVDGNENGAVVVVPAGAVLSSPTNDLTPGQVLDATSLPGRAPREGFIGSTTIITGTIIADVPTANDAFFEPNEGVNIGTVTSLSPPMLNGIEMVELTDASTNGRIVAGPIINEFGFEVDLSTITVGAAASAEGYFGDAEDKF